VIKQASYRTTRKIKCRIAFSKQAPQRGWHSKHNKRAEHTILGNFSLEAYQLVYTRMKFALKFAESGPVR
jgi:hypothetical protein